MLTANNSSMLGRDINPSRLTASLCSAAVVTMYKRRAGQTSGFHRASCQLSAVTQERNRCSTGNVSKALGWEEAGVMTWTPNCCHAILFVPERKPLQSSSLESLLRARVVVARYGHAPGSWQLMGTEQRSQNDHPHFCVLSMYLLT